MVQNFDWVMYIFGAFLVFTGIKMLRPGETTHDLAQSGMLRLLRSLSSLGGMVAWQYGFRWPSPSQYSWW